MNHLIFEERIQHKRQQKNQRTNTEPGGNRGHLNKLEFLKRFVWILHS